MPAFRSTVAFGLVLLAVLPARAVEITPFATRNLSPAALAHPLMPAETARLALPGKLRASFSLELASHAAVNRRDTEQLVLDGETGGATLRLRYGLRERLQLGVDLPWLRHGGGVLDGFIADWHALFGLPNGDRDTLPDDALAFRYTRDDRSPWSLSRTTGGIGDLRLLLAWQLTADPQGAAALQCALKAPTGSAARLTGGDGWDLSLALALERDLALSRGRAAAWAGLGASLIGIDGQAAVPTRDVAANAWLGAGWAPTDLFALKLQCDLHTPLYDSALTELGDPALILTLGGAFALGPNTTLELAVGEDLAVGVSPDVSFHLSLAHRF